MRYNVHPSNAHRQNHGQIHTHIRDGKNVFGQLALDRGIEGDVGSP